jgi:hypothetical protein
VVALFGSGAIELKARAKVKLLFFSVCLMVLAAWWLPRLLSWQPLVRQLITK